MNFIWLLSVAFMITGFMMVKKSENKQNIIEWIFLSVMLFACYNGIVAVLYTAVRLPIDLFTLMFANLAVGVCMIIQVIKSGERQKYKLFPADLVIMAGAGGNMCVCFCPRLWRHRF
jgi:peptidoglycan/LPS O-acetylase OafA/YrhL